MSLPKRVQAELQAAEALETQLQEQRQAAPPTVQTVAELAAPPAANEPPSAPQQTAAPPAPAPAPAKDYKQQYDTLKGMYSADVTALKRQLSEVTGQLATMAEQFQSMRQAQAAAPATAPSADPKDVENFGQDLIEMVQRYVEQRTTNVEDRVAALEASVNGVSQQAKVTQEQTFYATLTQLIPAWREINADQRWLAWLGEVDPVYGAPRQAALDGAFQRWDAPRVAAVFRAFVESLPATPPPESLADQVAPTSVASVAPTPAPPKQLLSEKFINNFYRDFGRGHYAGREAEARRIEAEIDQAVAEGRVR